MTNTVARGSQLDFPVDAHSEHRNSHRFHGFIIAVAASTGLWAVIGGTAWLVVAFNS